MKQALWTPTKARADASQMMAFLRYVEETRGQSLADYDALQAWSTAHIADFWDALWHFLQIKCSAPYTAVVDDLAQFPGAHWFVGARMNYAENLLRCREKTGDALVFRGEDHTRRSFTHAELCEQVARLATALRRDGVRPGDVVAGYLPNLPETVISMLAAAAVGAIWCSCATDIGPLAAIDRLGQTAPKVLITVDGYYYKGKVFDARPNAAQIAAGLPSLTQVVVAHYAENKDGAPLAGARAWDAYLAPQAPQDFAFEQLPAETPLVIMFSSGTTGKPKCMVQSAAGVLLNQLKELALHSDLGEQSTLLYIATCSWMMWNWQAAALGTGATVVLYDGNPSYPDTGAIWRILDEERVTAFGLSASYIHALMAQDFAPKDAAELTALQSVLQTGSALSDEGFAFVYDAIKKDVHFSSLSGGTDINGCFAIGNPLCPVYAGELQKPSLGMKIACFDDNGKPVLDTQGELVCLAPAPSMPLYFWNDADGARYHAAYFEDYPGVWRHGDYVVLHADTGGITFYGRSDSVLKPSGVRIGTSEIYNQVQKVQEVEDSLAIGQQFGGDQRILLFVKLKDGAVLDDALRRTICSTLRKNASPRHVPARIFAVPALPYTQSGKKVESAVTNLVAGRAVTNRDSLANPESLTCFETLLPEMQK